MSCNICKCTTVPINRAQILGKYSIQYYSCENCGFIQTEEPYWLNEAYASVIAQSDIGLVGRNIKLSNFCSAFIPLFYNSNGQFLDYGGGNGMFVRLMRDKGYNFYWQDKFSQNQFAKGFEVIDEEEFSILTAFEVFEHLSQPVSEIERMFSYSDTIIFTTRLLPRWNIAPNEWWYFTLDTGQHVSLYSKESLEFIANKFNVKLSTNGVSIHVLSPKKIPDVLLKALSLRPFASILSTMLNLGRHSLLDQDYYRLTNRKLN